MDIKFTLRMNDLDNDLLKSINSIDGVSVEPKPVEMAFDSALGASIPDWIIVLSAGANALKPTFELCFWIYNKLKKHPKQQCVINGNVYNGDVVTTNILYNAIEAIDREQRAKDDSQ